MTSFTAAAARAQRRASTTAPYLGGVRKSSLPGALVVDLEGSRLAVDGTYVYLFSGHRIVRALK